MKNKILILSFSLIVIFYKSQSASAYSYFGIGVMDNVDNARNLSLGGTGLALDSERPLYLPIIFFTYASSELLAILKLVEVPGAGILSKLGLATKLFTIYLSLDI